MPELLGALAPSILIVGLAAFVLPSLRPDNKTMRRLGAWFVIVLMVRYVYWRATETLPPLDLSFHVAAAYGFMALEFANALAGLLMLHVLSKTIDRSPEADDNPVDTFPGGAPFIDVFIPTYNEKRDILERTLIGAMALDYPNFRVWVLDDSRRPWLRELAESLGANYLTRPDNAHGKAGNMNNGLVHVFALPKQPDIIAVLDADFVPAPAFLRRAAALMHDPTVAIVQTPQHFFNPDPIQLNLGAQNRVPDEQRFFFDVILSSKDAHGTAFSCGTSGLVRAEALKAIGGFPIESVTEDLLMSLKMAAIGCRTVYLNERLSMGLAPEGLQEYLTQRGRWCLGTMQIVRTKWGPFSGRGGVPLLMRLHTLDTVLFWTIGSLMRLVAILLPLLYWWFGLVIMVTDLHSIAFYLGPYWFACVFYLAWVSRGTNLPIFAEAMGLLIAVESIRASVIGLFGAKNQKFEVTAKGTTRGRVVVQWSLVRWLLGLMVLTVAGIAWRTLQGPISGTPVEVEAMNMFWSVFNLLALTLACLMCVEQPRYRREERFALGEPAQLTVNGETMRSVLRDLSLVGCMVEPGLSVLVADGMTITVDIEQVGSVEGRVRRVSPAGIHIEFDVGSGQRPALIRKLFSGRYSKSVTQMDPAFFSRLALRRAVT